MARACRYESRLLRIAMAALLCGLTLCIPCAQAQSAAQGAATTGAPTSGPSFPQSPQVPRAPIEQVLDIRVVGLSTKTREQVLNNIGTRIGHAFDAGTYEKDIRKLSSRNWFVHVRPNLERVPGGIIITLEVVERPIVQYVTYDGNEKVRSRKTLEKESGIKKGDPLDPYAVQDGARKLETYYQGKGFNNVKITVLEGLKPGDRGVRYLINEGTVQKFKDIAFVGNSFSVAPDGRLKQIIKSKEPLFGLFKGRVDPKMIEEDEVKLEEYYRSLGFFQAKVGHDYELNEKEDRMTLVFYIHEGVRYKVRNISFIGNKIYPEDALNQDLKLNGTDHYDQSRMNADIGTVKDLYGSYGYVFCDVVADLRFFEEPGELDIVYQVSEGEQYRIGDINIVIKGENPHTRYSTVLNRLSMRPGDIADIRQFRSSERRLKVSGLYNVDPTKGDLPKIVFSPPDSEEALARNRKRSTAKRTGNPDTYRGQSPDPAARGVAPAPAPLPAARTVARPPVAMAAPTVTQAAYAQPQSPAPQAIAPQAAAPRTAPVRSDTGSILGTSSPYNPGAPTTRFQSPDYGGRAITSTPGGPQSYTSSQPARTAPVYGAPAQGYAQPAGTPLLSQAQPYAQPGYAPAGPPLPPPPQQPGGYLPPPGSVLSPQGPENENVIPIEIVVNEAQTGKFMFGAGVNSNAGLVGNIVIDEQNFDIWRVPTSWEDFRTGRAFRGAGQKFRIEASPGTQVSRYLFNFAEPYLFNTPVSLGLSGYYFNRFYRNWTEQRTGGRTSLGYQLTPDMSVNVALRAEDVVISNPIPSPATEPDLLNVLGHNPLYSVKPQLNYDTRDNTFLPTQGMFLSTDFEYVFGAYQFPRYMLNFQKHFLLRERPDGSGRHTLSYYTQFGISGNNTPIYERFYAGGFGTLRGFQFRGASPIFGTGANAVEVGGRLMNVNSLEYMFPITADDMLKGVVFCDFGTVEYTHSLYWSDYRIAPGAGLRVTIPMISAAPIALDFAFPVKKADNDLEQIFSFFVGVGH